MIAALALAQALHVGAAMQLFGASAFVWALAPAELAVAIGRPAWRLAAISTGVAAISALCWLTLEAAHFGGDWADGLDLETLQAVLFDTAFGQVWQIQLAVSAALIGLYLLHRKQWWLMCGLSASLLADLGFVGHTMLQRGPIGWLHHANHILHLVAAGAWIGSLVPLVFVMRYLDDAGLRQDASIALRRFSTIGHGLVALVLATGVLNTVLVLGHWPVDWQSPYQVLLAAKVTIVAAMIGLALVNRYGLVPRLIHEPERSLRNLRRNTLAEVALGGAVLIVVGFLGLLEPI